MNKRALMSIFHWLFFFFTDSNWLIAKWMRGASDWHAILMKHISKKHNLSVRLTLSHLQLSRPGACVVLNSVLKEASSSQGPRHKTDGIEGKPAVCELAQSPWEKGGCHAQDSRQTADIHHAGWVSPLKPAMKPPLSGTEPIPSLPSPPLNPEWLGTHQVASSVASTLFSIWLIAISCDPSNSNGMGWLKVLTGGLHHHNCQAVVSLPGQVQFHKYLLLRW